MADNKKIVKYGIYGIAAIILYRFFKNVGDAEPHSPTIPSLLELLTLSMGGGHRIIGHKDNSVSGGLSLSKNEAEKQLTAIPGFKWMGDYDISGRWVMLPVYKRGHLLRNMSNETLTNSVTGDEVKPGGIFGRVNQFGFGLNTLPYGVYGFKKGGEQAFVYSTYVHPKGSKHIVIKEE